MRTLALLLLALRAHAQGSPWTGNMHPSIGFPPGCNISQTGSCAPTYAALNASGALWPCPSGAPTNLTCGAAYACVPGEGDNPTCGALSPRAPCCCPRAGCSAAPLFNWVIGVCKGGSCACGAGGTQAPSCGSGRCDAKCAGAPVPCCFGTDVSALMPAYAEGTHAKINYVAAYDFNDAAGRWEIAQDSSFNTDGSRGAYDLMQPYGGLAPEQAWLAPQPGGSVFWSLGYYPAGVRGVGGRGGVMFVLSTEDWFWGTWYMLNTLTLERGPGVGYPRAGCSVTNDNCWASGNAGEMDFLEAGWNNPQMAAEDFRPSFATQNNQVGRCFQGGVNGGGFGSSNYLLTEASPLKGSPAEPIVYVAVVDSVGNFVYRIPAAQVGSIWPGLGRTTAAASLPAAPTRAPGSVNPGTTDFAATFASNCQARTYEDALAQECEFNGQQGFCVRWGRAAAGGGGVGVAASIFFFHLSHSCPLPSPLSLSLSCRAIGGPP